MKGFFVSMLTGHGVVLPLVVFALAGAAVFLVASRLAQYADAIADATGLGRMWIGSLLLAGSTSLPEIVTATSAGVFGLPNIGVGDLFGATLTNMTILAVLVFVYERRRILQSAALDHALVGALGIVLTAIAGMSIVSGGAIGVLSVGLDTVAIATIYVLVMRVVFELTQRVAQAPREESADTKRADPRSQVRRALLSFCATTAALLVIVPLLVFSAEAVAMETGVTATFVGTFLVAFTTTFPELATAIAAVRLGAVDLAVGNIFGSNAFNMTVLFAMDIGYREQPVLSAVSQSHSITAFAGAMAIAFGVMAILARTHKQAWVARCFAGAIVGIYCTTVYLLARGG